MKISILVGVSSELWAGGCGVYVGGCGGGRLCGCIIVKGELQRNCGLLTQ